VNDCTITLGDRGRGAGRKHNLLVVVAALFLVVVMPARAVANIWRLALGNVEREGHSDDLTFRSRANVELGSGFVDARGFESGFKGHVGA